MADRTIKKDTKTLLQSTEYDSIPKSSLNWLPSNINSNKMLYYKNHLKQKNKEQIYNQKLLLNQQEALSLTPTSFLLTPSEITFRQSLTKLSSTSTTFSKLNKFSESSDNSSSSCNNNNNSNNYGYVDNEFCDVTTNETNLVDKFSHYCDSNCISYNETIANRNFSCYSLIESKDITTSSSTLSLLSSSNNNNNNNITNDRNCNNYNYIKCWRTILPSMAMTSRIQSTLLKIKKQKMEIFNENSLLSSSSLSSSSSSIFHLSKAKNVMISSNNNDVDKNKNNNNNIKLINNINKLDKNKNNNNIFYKISTTIQLILFMIILRLKFLLFRLTKWQRTRSRNNNNNYNNNERIFKFSNKFFTNNLSFYIIMCLMIGTCKAIGQDVPTNCTFPSRWEGSWFLSGYQQSIQIRESQFSYRGKCIASDNNKYLIVDEKGCHRCLVIYEKHKNVLQYKESECEGDSMYMDQSMNPATMPIRSIVNSDRGGGVAHPNINGHSRLSSSDQYIMRSNDDKNDYFCKGRETLQTLCDQIPGDALLYSLFREQAEPVKCPLKGPFTFTYNRGHGECKSPVSNIDSCTEDSRLLLSFQACPDVQGTESTVEELTCLATWKDGNSRYLVGLVSHHHAISNEERFRCFVYEKISSMMAAFLGTLNNHNIIKDAEYKLAQSGDATCNGLDSAEVGSRIMTLRKPPLAERCDFPIWFREHRHWHALMANSAYQFHSSDGSLHFAKPNGYMETRALCEQINKQTLNEMMAVVHYTTGCKSGFMCMMFYRRDTYVSEIQIGTPASRLEDACAPDHFDIAKLPYITLLATDSESQTCPLEGLYNLRGAIGPPYITSRHKRNHNTNYNSIKGHNQHNNNHHHELQGHKRHETNQNYDENIQKISSDDTPIMNSHIKGHSHRNRRNVILNEYSLKSSINNNNNDNMETLRNHHYSNVMRNSRTLKLATRHSTDYDDDHYDDDITNDINNKFFTTNIIHTNNNNNDNSAAAAIPVSLNEDMIKKITITQQSNNQIINETQRNRRDAPGCIVNYKAQRQLLVGCNEVNQIDVRPICTEDGDEVYLCHGTWAENGTTYIIAKHSGSRHGVCLSYRQLEGNSAKLIIGDACYRGYQKAPDHHLIANLTNFGKCGDSSSSTITGTNTMLTFIGKMLFLLMTQLS